MQNICLANLDIFFSGNHSKQQFSRASVLYFLFPDKGWGGGIESMFVGSLKVILFWGGGAFLRKIIQN